MKIVKTKKELAGAVADFREQGFEITLIPTMGALHEGHLSLVRQAMALGGKTVCSIFVNPTQFNDPEDLIRYPRPVEQDIALLKSVGCDLLFLPEVSEMYSAGDELWEIDLGTLDQVLEGEKRPGHFKGVTQIVYKLFDAVQPDRAIFGQKDLQQYLVIEEMIRQKQLPVGLLMGPTVREPEGLALSSRNVRLSPEGKKQALVLSRTLQETESLLPLVAKGELSLQDLRRKAIDRLRDAPGVTLEYFAICDRETLLDADENTPIEKLVALVAAWVEGVRLIDNVVFGTRKAAAQIS